jgi:hypothetical protein
MPYDKPEDVNRTFIIQVYLEDDSIQIMEPPLRNSGFKGGVFLTRCAIPSATSNGNITPTDIYIGNTITMLSHKFVIHNADEFTLKVIHMLVYSLYSFFLTKTIWKNKSDSLSIWRCTISFGIKAIFN